MNQKIPAVKTTTLSNKRKLEMFDSFCSTLTNRMCCMDLIGYFTGIHSFEDFVQEGCGEEDRNLINDLFESLNDEECKLLFRPYLAKILTASLDTKVTIEW